MKSERKAALLAITENIEMKLFSSEESCVVIPAQEKDEKYSFDQVCFEVKFKEIEMTKKLWLDTAYSSSNKLL